MSLANFNSRRAGAAGASSGGRALMASVCTETATPAGSRGWPRSTRIHSLRGVASLRVMRVPFVVREDDVRRALDADEAALARAAGVIADGALGTALRALLLQIDEVGEEDERLRSADFCSSMKHGFYTLHSRGTARRHRCCPCTGGQQ